MNHLERFRAVMEYEAVDRCPSWELAVWAQTKHRWKEEGLDIKSLHWDWFTGEEALGMDPKEFIAFNGAMLPPFERLVLESDERTETVRHPDGCVRKSLKAGSVNGASACMDTFLRFSVETPEDWREVKKRFNAPDPDRLEPNWRDRVAGWRQRTKPLIFGTNCSTMGFFWLSRVLMGTEGVSYNWYDQPSLMHEIMEFWENFLIESARPILAETDVDYICLSEDMAMKTGPLLSPHTYLEFIYPHMKRVVEFFKTNGVHYVAVDTDGNPEPLIPMLMEAGVDIIWPLERAADQDPVRLRKKYGKSLRLWGGVDKRELAKDPAAIDAHLRELQPLVQEGGYVPTVDHAVSPDISWPNFQHYMKSKAKMLEGKL